MKVRVLKQFIDTADKKLKDVGYVFEATAERVAQINDAGFGPLVEKIEVKKVVKKTVKKESVKEAK